MLLKLLSREHFRKIQKENRFKKRATFYCKMKERFQILEDRYLQPKNLPQKLNRFFSSE